jgi:hypothetical protein
LRNAETCNITLTHSPIPARQAVQFDQLTGLKEAGINDIHSNLVVSNRGLFGLRKRVAGSWDKLRFDEDNHAPMLEVDRDFIKRAPEYKRD